MHLLRSLLLVLIYMYFCTDEYIYVNIFALSGGNNDDNYTGHNDNNNNDDNNQDDIDNDNDNDFNLYRGDESTHKYQGRKSGLQVRI